MNNRDSLRLQLIAAIASHDSIIDKMNAQAFAERFFEEAIWPTLDAAMTAGELLVSRSTKPQLPTNEAIEVWLNECVAVIDKIRPYKATVSRGHLIKILLDLGGSAERAAAEARATREKYEGVHLGLSQPNSRVKVNPQ